MTEDAMLRALRSALRFAASRSAITAAEERAILDEFARQHGDGGREAIFRGALDEALYCLSQFKLLAKITDRQKARLQEIIDCARSRIKALAPPALPDTTGREILAQIYEAGGDKAAAFTLRCVGAVGTVLSAQAEILERALSFSRQRVDDQQPRHEGERP